MKRIINYSLLVFVLVFMGSCDKGLENLNINQTSPTAIDPAFQLNNAVINLSFPSATLIWDIGIVQQIISPNGGVLAGANFNQDNRSSGQLWPTYYQNVVKNTHDVIVRTKDDPARSNLYNMARIIEAYAYMILTDTYSNVPYSEGGAGYSDQIFFPKYDAQQDIYPKLLQEFSEASAALNPAGKIEGADLLYAGNVEQWKKFGYSLLLRAGMRLSKVDAEKAKSTVQAAVAAGVILENKDNAVMLHDANYTNPIGNTLNSTEAANFYLTKPFVDQLKNTGDPRLSAIAVRYVGATSGPGQTTDIASSSPSVQIGMPMGKDNGTVVTAAAADGLASFYDYSQVDRRRMVKNSSPGFFVTASQTLLLLAEARLRGWITTGTEQEYYDAGVRAHMNQLASYDAAAAVPASAIQPYLDANPYNSATGLDQINTQYWISSFLNGPEAFANFRRSGYPALTPNPYGQPNNPDVPNGTFIRRLTYPTTELSANTDNVNDAIAQQGPDRLDTRVWWDK
ncbi:MAG TPA: SusD/RagB family nutrient-binding outer membrane lipoprotein [Agriterribacter sp.]|nr:SusD/RagB family nutrient-binding outer membrane lipoprotein [Agriterribacter sp.]